MLASFVCAANAPLLAQSGLQVLQAGSLELQLAAVTVSHGTTQPRNISNSSIFN